MNNFNILDLFLIGFGVYSVYAALQMRLRGSLPVGLMSGADAKKDNIKDKEGFLRFMFGRILFLGIVSCLAGAVGIIMQLTAGPPVIDMVLVAVYFFILIYYAAAYNKARKTFL